MSVEAAVFERVPLGEGQSVWAWESPDLNDVGAINAIGEVPTGGDGLLQWERGIRHNLDPGKYPEADRPIIEAVNGHGYAMMENWAALAGLQAVVRPSRSTGDGGVAGVGGEDFRRTARGTLVAIVQHPADVLVVTGNNIPDGVDSVGIMYGVADSHTVSIADRAGTAVGVVHGLRNAIIDRNVAQTAVTFMHEVTGIDAGNLIAVIGPGVGRCCDEVGVQKPGTEPREGGTVWRVRAAMDRGTVPADALETRVDPATGSTAYFFDTSRALRHQLMRAGVGTVRATSECTAQLAGKGGHVMISAQFPSLRRADERGQRSLVTPDGRILEVPEDKEHRPDSVTRYPVIVGLRR
jgi:copper oxidase (laccase) domain-containing protein